jgi:hypothetical protein
MSNMKMLLLFKLLLNVWCVCVCVCVCLFVCLWCCVVENRCSVFILLSNCN